LVVVIGAPLIVYRSAGRRAYAHAIEALGRGDCKGAVPELSRVIGAYRFAPGVPVADAREAIDECRVISDGDAKARRGDLRGALSGFRDLVEKHPRSALVPYARKRWGEVGSQWAAKLVILGNFKTAIETYEDLSGAFAGSALAAEARDRAAKAYIQLAAMREANTSNAFHWQDAVDDYKKVLEDYAETDAAGAAQDSIERLYRKAANGVSPGHGCDPLDILRALTRDDFHVQDGTPLLPSAQYRCVAWEVGHGYSSLAVDDIADFLNTYPHDPNAPQARLLLIEARVASFMELGLQPALGPPDAAGTAPPGTASVTITNLFLSGRYEVLFSGPEQAKLIVSPQAAGTLSLEPGTYVVVVVPTDGSDIDAPLGTWHLAEGVSYTFQIDGSVV